MSTGFRASAEVVRVVPIGEEYEVVAETEKSSHTWRTAWPPKKGAFVIVSIEEPREAYTGAVEGLQTTFREGFDEGRPKPSAPEEE